MSKEKASSNIQIPKEYEKQEEDKMKESSKKLNDFSEIKDSIGLKKTCISENEIEENLKKSQNQLEEKKFPHKQEKKEETPQNFINKEETPKNYPQNNELLKLLNQQKDLLNPYRQQNDSNQNILGNIQNIPNLIKNISDLSLESNINNNSNNININRNINNSNSIPLFINENKEGTKSEQPNFNFNRNNNRFTRKIILYSLNNQVATKMLQSIIKNEASSEDINTIVKELIGIYSDIIKNKNGNYLFSDIYSVCNNNNRFIILKELSTSIADDCLNKYATHSIQTIINFSNSEEEYSLILSSFDYNKTLMASLDSTGSYVIQKIIEHIPERYRQNFNIIFISFICFIVNKKFGVVSAKKFIEKTNGEKISEKIAELTIGNFFNIATNTYGRYFIQHLLIMWNNTSYGDLIKQQIIINFRTLFQNKISSYICDIFLKMATKQEKNNLIKSLNLNIIIRSPNYEIDRMIMLKIMNSLGYNFGSNSNNNQIQNQNQFSSPNNVNINSINDNNQQNQNQFPFSLNYSNKNNNFKKDEI